MKKITIAIDGFSSCGKSTVARQLAKKIGYTYIDSGAMYRAITLHFIRIGLDLSKNSIEIKEALQNIKIEFELNPASGNSEITLNGKNIENEIRGMEVSNQVSQVSAVSEIRRFLVSLQKEYGKNKGVVMDGRDIGTIVFPEAELKIFMTADPMIRAKRRFDELKSKGDSTTLEDILKNVEQRDYEDTTRKDSPLQKAEDAIELDNSHMTREEQLQILEDLVRQKMELKTI